jgi:hypothetical protein
MPRATNSRSTKSRARSIPWLWSSSRGRAIFAGQLGVLPLLGCFNGVPQAFAFPQLLGNAGGRHHLGMDDAALIGKIVMAVEPLVVKP